MKHFILKSLSIVFIIISLLNYNCTENNTQKDDSLSVRTPGYAFRNKYKITISLQKQIYREFEPVILKIELINTSKTKRDFYEEFGFDSYKTGVRVQDSSGKLLERGRTIHIDPFYDKPTHSVGIKETLNVSMSINDCGITACSKDNDGNELMYQYFPSGKYYVHIGPNRLRSYSNYVSFNVINNNEEELSILDLLRVRKYSKIITEYPSNVYSEYVESQFLIEKWNDKVFYKEFGERNEILSSYTSFFKKYPNSYYLLNDYFMYSYFNTVCSDSSRAQIVLDSVKTCNKDNLINDYLNNKYRVKLILNKNYKHYPFESE